MTRIYVCESGARVSVRDGALVVLVDGRTQASIPVEQVSSLSCFGPIHFSGHGLAQLLDHGIRLDLFSGSGRYRGTLSDGRGASLFVRMAHHDRWRDPAYRLELARALVREKLRAQQRLLESRDGGDLETVERAAKVLERLLPRIDHVPSVPALMGLEGDATSAWFDAFGTFLLEGIPFAGRSRRPPRDAPNALLSLGYVLLGAEIAGMLEAAGLDPGLAFLHGFRYGRLSLAYDVIEEVRQPVIDAWVLSLFNRRHVRLEQFESRNGGVYLRREAFREVLKVYQRHMGRFGEGSSWRGRLEQRVAQLRDAVLDGVMPPPPEW